MQLQRFIVQVKRHHHDLFFLATERTVQASSGQIIVFRPQPRLTATKFAPSSEQSLHQLRTNPVTLQSWSDADLVDEQLRRGVRVNVMHGGREPNDYITLECHDQVMSGIGEEFRCPARTDRRIKNLGRNRLE